MERLAGGLELEIYNLSTGYELIVLPVGGPKSTRLFIHVGLREDVSTWIENHRDYRWLRGPNGIIDFVPFLQIDPAEAALLTPDLSSPERVLEVPLLKDLTASQWSVAVGTGIAPSPPRRSGRAELPHPAPTSGVWRKSADSGDHARPADAESQD